MADGVKGAAAQIAQDIGEAIVKPVVDEFAQALEQGVQTVAGTQKQLTPQQIQQKRQDDEKKLAEARYKVEWWKRLEVERAKVRQQKQQQLVAVQQQEQVQRNQQKVLQFEAVKKDNMAEEVKAKISAEKKMGRGVGG